MRYKNHTTTAGEYNIASAPLYYVRSGYVYIIGGQFRVAGNGGYGWSSRGLSGTQAYYLYFNTGTGMSPSNYGSRYSGYSLRCLSTV